MKLKLYQEKVLAVLKEYLSALADFNGKYKNALAIDPDIARDYNYPQRAFTKTTGKTVYHSKTNGIREQLPMFI